MAKRKAKGEEADKAKELGLLAKEPKEEKTDGMRQEGEGKEEAAPAVEKVGQLRDDSSDARRMREEVRARNEALRVMEEEDVAAEEAAEDEVAEETAEEARSVEVEDSRDAEEAARAERDKALRDEVTRLRAKNRELMASQAQFQAPPPVQVTPPSMDPAATGAALPTEPPARKWEIGPDGDVRETDESRRAYDAYNRAEIQRQVAAMTRKDPQQEFVETVASERARWIGYGEDAPRRGEIAERAEQATRYLSEVTDNYLLSTGTRVNGIAEVVEMIEQSGIGDSFRSYFPEFGDDVWSFVDAFFAPGAPKDRVQRMRRYMDSRVVSQGHSAAPPADTRAQAPSTGSNVMLLPTKPRSMAKKGSAQPVDTGSVSRLRALEEKAAVNPVGMAPKEWEELDGLQKQHGAA